jgi:molybdopterin synthase catalytic subunit
VHIRVRLFALQRQQLGRRELELELLDGASIEEAWRALAAGHPILEPARAAMRFARNGAYAEPGERLADGDELALIPPVAGGDGRDRRIALTAEPIDAPALDRLREGLALDEDGALVEFLGRTRVTPGSPAPGQEAEAARFIGQRVVGLEYEAYETMALRVLEAIADEIEHRFDVRRLAILHRTGPVALGETSVAIAAAAPHREAAFAACRYAIEELKARAPIWKSERFTDGSVWLGAPARAAPPTEAR